MYRSSINSQIKVPFFSDTTVFTEYVFCESVDSAHISQISSTFQEADCLVEQFKVNKQVFALT